MHQPSNSDNNPISALSFVGKLTTNATSITVTPPDTGDYVCVIGAEGNFDRGTTGTVSVSQEGITFSGFSALTAATRGTITVVGGRAITFAVASGDGSEDITIALNKIGSRRPPLPA